MIHEGYPVVSTDCSHLKDNLYLWLPLQPGLPCSIYVKYRSWNIPPHWAFLVPQRLLLVHLLHPDLTQRRCILRNFYFKQNQILLSKGSKSGIAPNKVAGRRLVKKKKQRLKISRFKYYSKCCSQSIKWHFQVKKDKSSQAEKARSHSLNLTTQSSLELYSQVQVGNS